MHNNNCVEEPTHKVRLFSVTIKRGVSLKKSRYSRTEARCTYAGTESRGHRFYAWRRNDRLLSMRSHLRKSPVMYDYDSFGTLVCASLDMSECLFKTPDIIGNVYRDRDARGRVYDRSGRLLKDEKNYYRYDGEGNLILKSTRNVLEPPVMPQPKDWLDKLFTRTTPNDKELLTHYVWQQGDTAYEWYGNGMLKSVRTPEGATIRFEYNALGRRTLKETHDTCHRYAWDGNVLLHEWNYDRREKPSMEKDELGRIRYDRQEPHTNLITWVYDGGSYTPVAKLTEEDSYSIVQDYLGTPIQALDSKGEVVWDCILDIYGDVLELRGKRDFIPFRFQGQYEDGETGLYYNRFRYYSPHTGNYISQDPIGLTGGNPTLYGYVRDSNIQIDSFGLDAIPNKVAGNAREAIALEHLKKQHPNATILRERYIRDASGKSVRDAFESRRRLDFVVIEDGKVKGVYEVTSPTADKTAQMLKETDITR